MMHAPPEPGAPEEGGPRDLGKKNKRNERLGHLTRRTGREADAKKKVPPWPKPKEAGGIENSIVALTWARAPARYIPRKAHKGSQIKKGSIKKRKADIEYGMEKKGKRYAVDCPLPEKTRNGFKRRRTDSGFAMGGGSRARRARIVGCFIDGNEGKGPLDSKKTFGGWGEG